MMRYLITENQLNELAYRFVLKQLDAMDFKIKKNREFSFFPKGSNNPDHGVEADWMKGEGYDILVGHSLWRSVRDVFSLTDDQTQTAFIRAFMEKGITKISRVSTIDFSDVEKLMGLR